MLSNFEKVTRTFHSQDIFELADKLKANNEGCDRISWKLGGYDYCPSQGFVVVRVYGGAFAYSNY